MASAENIDETSEPTSLCTMPERSCEEPSGPLDSLGRTQPEESSAPVERTMIAPPRQDEDEHARLEEFEKLFADSELSYAKIARFTASQMARIVREVSRHDPTVSPALSTRQQLQEVKVLGALHHALIDCAKISHQDVLNLAGPKFKFVFQKLIVWFIETLEEVGIDGSTCNQIMLRLHDRVVINEESLCEELKKL